MRRLVFRQIALDNYAISTKQECVHFWTTNRKLQYRSEPQREPRLVYTNHSETSTNIFERDHSNTFQDLRQRELDVSCLPT